MHTPPRIGSLVHGLGAAVLALAAGVAAGPAPAHAMSPAATTDTASAWIVVRHPKAVPGEPGPLDHGNSAGGTMSWTRNGRGDYTVLVGAIDGDGVPVVSAIGAKPRSCVVPGWGGAGSTVISVQCFDRHRVLADTPFALTYTNGDAADAGSPGSFAHYWLDSPGGDSTPIDYYAHQSNGETATVVRVQTGRYRTTLPGFGDALSSGTVLVTAYGGAGACSVKYWVSTADALTVDVWCRNLRGAFKDTFYDFLFLRELGPEGYGGGPAAYLYAGGEEQGTSHPYAPLAWQSNGKRSTVSRLSKGVYTVTLKGLPKGGAAVVSAYGSTAARCQVGSIRTDRAPAKVQVRCFSVDGTPKDSRFTLAWTR